MTLIPTQIPVQSDLELTLPEDRWFFSPQTVEPSPERMMKKSDHREDHGLRQLELFFKLPFDAVYGGKYNSSNQQDCNRGLPTKGNANKCASYWKSATGYSDQFALIA